MSKHAKNISPNSSAPSFSNSFLNLCTIPFVGTMTFVDSMPLLYPNPMPCRQSNSLVKCFNVFSTVTSLSSSKLKVAAVDVPLAKKPTTRSAQQRLSLVVKVVLYAVFVILEVLHLSNKSRCCMAHL